MMFGNLFGLSEATKNNIDNGLLSILDDGGLNTCFRGLDYKDALKYAEKYGTITNRSDYYIEFVMTLNNKKINVTLNKQPFDEKRYAIFGATSL
ncbi:hypothetical protein [Sulfurospirillum diekertiae]|uniref:Uncharacterized protein n=1 Tax=Sulfurospirillum diekertiae TaxID=1854492 RepID=A0AA92FFB0_9BACT|nr:hypothetical protein [Sulfurospirillum diekertiae]QIR75217.1 hypothetical protein FA584_02880 [Sulfurospirillum diekertiae]